MIKPHTIPITGATNIGATTLGHTPVARCVDGFNFDQWMTDQLLWPDASAAPHRPPIRA